MADQISEMAGEKILNCQIKNKMGGENMFVLVLTIILHNINTQHFHTLLIF